MERTPDQVSIQYAAHDEDRAMKLIIIKSRVDNIICQRFADFFGHFFVFLVVCSPLCCSCFSKLTLFLFHVSCFISLYGLNLGLLYTSAPSLQRQTSQKCQDALGRRNLIFIRNSFYLYFHTQFALEHSCIH